MLCNRSGIPAIYDDSMENLRGRYVVTYCRPTLAKNRRPIRGENPS